MKWLELLTGKREKRQIQVIRSTNLRLEDWRRDESLVRWTVNLMNSAEFQTLMAVLRNESPTSFQMAMGATHDDRIAHACRAEGYHLCLNNLEALGRLATKPEYIESTFEPERHTPQ